MIEDGKEKKWHVVAYANKVSTFHRVLDAY
jgi:hypothetical protein